MKKLYLFLMAMVLSLPAFAQSVSDLEGNWTFKVYDYANDPSMSNLLTIDVTCTTHSASSTVYFATGEKNLYFTGSYYNGVVTFSSEGPSIVYAEDNNVPQVNSTSWYYAQETFYINDSGNYSTGGNVKATYDAATESFTEYATNNAYIKPKYIGIDVNIGASRTAPSSIGTMKYVIVEAAKSKGNAGQEPITDPSQMAGDWTFEVNVDGSSEVTTLAVTARYDYGEIYFTLPDDKGEWYAGSVTDTNYNGGNYLLRFDQIYSLYSIGENGNSGMTNSYYYDGDIDNQTNIFGEFDPATRKFVKFYRQNALKTAYIALDSYYGFIVTIYSSMIQNSSTQISKTNYRLVSAYMGQPGASEPSNSITVSLPADSYSASYMSATAAQIKATPTVVANGFESFQVFYSLMLNSDGDTVKDTEVTPTGDDYVITIPGLEFERNYTLKVWAVSGEYKSDVAEASISTWSIQPDLRLTTSPATDITDNSAKIPFTVRVYDMAEITTLTVKATSAGGPAAETPVSLTGTSANGSATGTLEITGLTGGTAYSYSLSVSATDINGVTVTYTNPSPVTFTTLAPAEPEITFNFADDFVSFTKASSYVDITVSFDVEANIPDDEYSVYYYLYSGTPLDNPTGTLVTKGTNGKYTVTKQWENYGRDYTIMVWAVAPELDYTSQKVTRSFTTPEKPGVKILSAEARNVTETTADIVVNFETIDFGENVKFSISASSITGPSASMQTSETTATLSLEGLSPGILYTYDVSVYATAANGNMDMKTTQVIFTTEELAYSIVLSEISHSQIPNGVTINVGSVVATGIDDDASVDVYVSLPGVIDTPVKADLVDGVYTYTIENLEPQKRYTAVLFGGVGTLGADDFIKGEEYRVNFVSGDSTEGIGSVTVDNDDARYFNLQGVEVKNPDHGVYIKVSGNETNKVLIK